MATPVNVQHVTQRAMATKAIRSGSPVLCVSKKNEKKVKEMVQPGDDKIHRIILNSVCYAKFVWATSPSCLWFRLPNQDPGFCDLRERYRMNPYQGEHARFRYCMAPRFESDNDAHELLVYSRARILSLQNDEEAGHMYCYVLFIDHGFGHWVDSNSLGAVPYDLTSIPWQTIPVALAGVRPLQMFDSTNSGWSKFHVNTMKKIMTEFDQFEVSPLVYRGSKLTYDQYSRARITGVRGDRTVAVKENDNNTGAVDDEDDEKYENDGEQVGEDESDIDQFDITRIFFQRCMRTDPVQLSLEISELNEQPLYEVMLNEEIPDLDVRQIPMEYTVFPRDSAREGSDGIACVTPPKKGELIIPDFVSASPKGGALSPEFEQDDNNEVNEEARWDSEMTQEYFTEQVPEADERTLSYFSQGDARWTMIAIDSAFRESPHKFYAYPMKPRRLLTAKECNLAMQEFYQGLSKWRDQLNAFYFLTENCFVLSFDYLKTVQSAGQDVYAVFCDTDESDNHTFTRVKLIECYPERNGLHEHCQIVFLDRPGSRVVPSGTLLRLHSKFAKVPQMCVEMKLNINPPNGIDWDSQQVDQFREVCFADAPMRCKILKVTKPGRSKHLRKFLVCDLTPAWMSVKFGVEKQLLDAKMAA